MSSPFLGASFALIAAVCWGAGDFSGGLAARRSNPFLAVLLSYSVGLTMLILVAFAREEKLTTLADLAWGAMAGLCGMVGVGCLYRGFYIGRMGIVAPISGVLATALPVIFEAFAKGLPQVLKLVGFGVAILGIWLLSRPEPLGRHPQGLGMAVLAGLGFGCFFISLGQVGTNAVFWPLVAGRAAAVIVMFAFALVTRRKVNLTRSPLRLLLLAGVLDVSGNLFFLLGIQNGRLDTTAVLGSLYPAVTAVIAWWTIKERMTRLQVLGICAAILAIVLITL
jgi:drug/metabolite transporter (DMT)-like permease